MIRRANLNDQAAVVELLHDSHVGAGFDREDGPTGFVFDFVPGIAEFLFRTHVNADRLLCLALDVSGVGVKGVLMAAAAEHRFGRVRLARETVWWIDPAHRGPSAVRMLDFYEAWARDQGCAFCGMAGMGDDPGVAALYRRRGYKVAETHFLKPLTVA